MPRILLIDERIGEIAPRLAAEATEADVVAHFSAATSLTRTLPQVRRAWLNRYQHPSAALCIAACGSLGRLLLGTEGLSTTNANLLVPMRGFAGGRVILWGGDAGNWAVGCRANAPLAGANAPSLPGEAEHFPDNADPIDSATALENENTPRRSVPANPGRALLLAIAQALGLPVVANLHSQLTRATWRLGGRHVIVEPSGAFALSDAID